ncbi:hypothetical protein M407DRAFT_222646 [Tulasnella calospora MUT 4182]|uniref:Uncharacterized protein n=1 Tax=Tulasnella calospora MUT 4182 TaxID=1051891 RepID=A0A0C3KDT1_9AGAM|nr:hypothetical protein M407DRAFT_222646 [Tulasnella calospora MUT 4182]
MSSSPSPSSPPRTAATVQSRPRKRTDRCADSNASDDELAGPKRKRRQTDPLVRTGKHIARTVHIKFHALTILQHGVEILAQHEAGEIEEFPCVDSDERWRIFSGIMKLIPDAKRKLTADTGEEYLTRLASALDEGISAGRSDDTNGLKKAIADWVSTSEGRIPRNSKSGRGFHNIATARLLAPPQYNVQDNMTLRKLRDELIRPSTSEYPAFMYKDFTIDPENLIDGLFESDLLLKAAKHILIGPSSADSLETSTRSTRLGNAALNNMQEVSLPFMAYVCTQVRFALSSDEVFGQNAGRSFDIYGFYRNVLKTLQDDELAEDFEVIQSRWNEIIFGGGDATEPEEEHGTLRQILAQRAGL